MANAIESVVTRGYCTGCGLCAAHFGEARVKMAMVSTGYLRPQLYGQLDAVEATEFLRFCPGISLDLHNQGVETHVIWGPIASCSTGWSTDEEIRYRGSSGGAISAVLVALLETGEADFVVHVGADENHPFRNKVRISRNRADVLRGAGSRYSPSAPLEVLDEVLTQPGQFAFVGKPCDAAGLRSYIATRPQIAGRVVAILSFMCAGIPSERGSEEIVRKMGGDPGKVVAFSYRGNGWPGMATARMSDGRQLEMDYATSWGTILNRHLQFRCKICPDGTGEFADLVCADAWYGKDGYPDFEEKAGRSLILARTPRGQALLQAAVTSRRLEQKACPVDDISLMQPYQETRKRLLASRLLALFLRRGRLPRFRGMRLVRAALGVGTIAHLRNLLGTWKRVPAFGQEL